MSGTSPGACWRAGGRDACWVRASGDRCVPLRTLLQQLQKLQTLVTNKISRPYKMAATQTGTCLMVGLLPPTGLRRASSPGGFLRGGGVDRPWKDWQYDGQHHQAHHPSAQGLLSSPLNLLEHGLPWPVLTVWLCSDSREPRCREAAQMPHPVEVGDTQTCGLGSFWNEWW